MLQLVSFNQFKNVSCDSVIVCSQKSGARMCEKLTMHVV